jgi:hypothetical protein
MTNLERDVWVTTPSHLQRFTEVRESNSLIKRLRGNWDLPADFPRSSQYQIPVVLLSAGDLILEQDSGRLVYTHNPGPRYKNLRDLSFSTQLRGLEICLAVPFKLFEMLYISFRVKGAGVDPVFLTVSGRGLFISRIRRRTSELFAEMVKAGATPLPSNNHWRGP